MCNRTQPAQPFWTAGTEQDLVENGGTYGGAKVTVDCVVTPVGASGFGITLEAHQGEQFGTEISGIVTDSPGPQPNITATFDELNGGSYSSSSCTLTLTTATPMPVAPGRIWATVACPSVDDPEIANGACAAEVTLMFQNCQQ